MMPKAVDQDHDAAGYHKDSVMGGSNFRDAPLALRRKYWKNRLAFEEDYRLFQAWGKAGCTAIPGLVLRDGKARPDEHEYVEESDDGL